MKIRMFFVTALILSTSVSISVYGEESAGSVEEKLYNFDDMLIDGAFRDPQGMFERARTEAEFESVLKLERSFIRRIEDNTQESSMRP